jgi:N-acetylmuramoyl-L-alanine amidase
MNRASLALLAVVAMVSQACRGTVPPTGTGPAPAVRPNAPPGAPAPSQALPVFSNLPPTLPQVPLVEGPLAPKVVYPQWNHMITSRDSNFIFGSVGNGLATLTVNGQEVRVWPNGAFLGFVPNPPPTSAQFMLVARLGADSAMATHQVRVAGMTPPVPDSLKPPPPTITDTVPTWIILRDTSLSLSDTDRVVIGRPQPNTTYRWFFFPNTRVQLTGRYPGYARVRLDSGLDVWVDALDAKNFATDTMPPRRFSGNLRVRPSAEWVDVQFPIGERPPYLVEERDKSLVLTLYGTRGNTDLVSYPSSDSLVRYVEWAQELNDRVRYTVSLSVQPFGYLVIYENGLLTLRIRRPPVGISHRSGSSLTGLTIAVDAGHPPQGSTGPTGLFEADATLPVGIALKRILEERGAQVVMTRSSREGVDLQVRPAMARRGNAHAFVSIHYNAYPDGVNPFLRANGIEVYFYRPHSEPLARALQRELIDKQQLDDQGVHFRSLAVVRSTWFPAVLTEGGFIIVPEQENAMRTEQWQERYARALADGLEKYFRALRSH